MFARVRDDGTLEFFLHNISKVYYFSCISFSKELSWRAPGPEKCESIFWVVLVRNRAYEIMTNITNLFRILRHRFIDPVAVLKQVQNDNCRNDNSFWG
jgi:hypothetical protein